MTTSPFDAEAQLAQTAKSLQAVLNSSPASIGLLKARRDENNQFLDFIFLACNQKFVELTGQSPADLVGASVRQFANRLWYDDTFDKILHRLTTEGAATLLNLMNTEEDRADMLAMLQRNLRQVTQMLTQLLDYSRLEASQELFQPSTFDAVQVLGELIAVLQPMAAERNLVLSSVGPEPLSVEGDLVKVRRITQNLILNALRLTLITINNICALLSARLRSFAYSAIIIENTTESASELVGLKSSFVWSVH
ncbi:PAS domain-containing sensor histidine kinase [Spirosoma flavum]|uniref:PAS domain-containing sensor histidine kinase n=1 Tax=Spirosoma flavum TaxID=2048557 RepID=A0ABW6AIP0_9BACT